MQREVVVLPEMDMCIHETTDAPSADTDPVVCIESLDEPETMVVAPLYGSQA